MSCGGSFRSSWCTDFHGALRFALHFFTSLDCPLEQCDQAISRHGIKVSSSLNSCTYQPFDFCHLLSHQMFYQMIQCWIPQNLLLVPEVREFLFDRNSKLNPLKRKECPLMHDFNLVFTNSFLLVSTKILFLQIKFLITNAISSAVFLAAFLFFSRLRLCNWLFCDDILGCWWFLDGNCERLLIWKINNFEKKHTLEGSPGRGRVRTSKAKRATNDMVTFIVTSQ